MENQAPRINIGRALAFAFDDPGWPRKILLGAAAVLLSTPLTLFVGAFALLGYAKALFRGLAFQNDDRLPEWDDIGRHLTEGVKGFAVALPYLMLVWFVTAVPTFFGGLLSLVEGAATVAWLTACCCGYPLSAAVGLAVALALPLALSVFFATEDVAAAYHFPSMLEHFRKHLHLHILLFVTALFGGLVAAAGSVAFFIGVLFTGFWSLLFVTHAMAQVWRLTHDAPAVPQTAGEAETAAPSPAPLSLPDIDDPGEIED